MKNQILYSLNVRKQLLHSYIRGLFSMNLYVRVFKYNIIDCMRFVHQPMKENIIWAIPY